MVVACPRCGGLARYETLISGNTLGARVWTDGKVEAPMLPRPPEVVRCSHCGAYYWLRQAEKVGYLEQWEMAEGRADPTWLGAPRVEEPEEAGYYEAIREGLAGDREEEKKLRVLARVTAQELQWAVSQIRALCRARDVQVRELAYRSRKSVSRSTSRSGSRRLRRRPWPWAVSASTRRSPSST